VHAVNIGSKPFGSFLNSKQIGFSERDRWEQGQKKAASKIRLREHRRGLRMRYPETRHYVFYQTVGRGVSIGPEAIGAYNPHL
jgi:hypothetical protein